jgi:prepilin-type N-terminal cleavage/methylation domain-containing protein
MPMTVRNQHGYSLVELLVVIGILGTLSGMAAIQIGASRPVMVGDGALRAVMAQMTLAREMAITQRRNMRLTFSNYNVVSIVREEVPGPTLTTVSSKPIEGGITFLMLPGMTDTPDHFGRSSAVDFGGATEIKFGPEGTLLDQDGGSLNGTVFLALPGQGLSARAATILGSTGRVRGYRWNGHTWVLL